MTKTHSDEELIFMLQNDLEQLYNIFYQKYFRFIRSIISNINFYIFGLDKSDLYQVACIALYKALSSYRESEGKFITYLKQCVQNSVHRMLRNNFLVCSEEEIKNFHSDLFCPENYSDFYDSYNNIQNIIAGLKPLQSKAWHLYHQGYSYQEISNKLNINTKRVDNIIRKIKDKILEI